MTNRLRSITDFDKTRTESGNFGPAHSFNESRNSKRQKFDNESLSSSNSTIQDDFWLVLTSLKLILSK
jgi:hypothetical protein